MKYPLRLILSFSLALYFILTVQAQTFENQAIVINPIADFDVEVFVNKDQSGKRTPNYKIGEEIRIGVKVSEASYVYLFNIRRTGEVTQILPNYLDFQGKNNYLTKNQTKYFPPRNANYTFNVDGPTGIDKVFAVASKTPLDTKALASFTSGEYFASSKKSESEFAQTLSIIIKPIEDTKWVTDTASFNVRY